MFNRRHWRNFEPRECCNVGFAPVIKSQDSGGQINPMQLGDIEIRTAALRCFFP